jgi:hypothetical protein
LSFEARIADDYPQPIIERQELQDQGLVSADVGVANAVGDQLAHDELGVRGGGCRDLPVERRA